MKAILKTGILVLVPENDAETAALADWKAAHVDHVMYVTDSRGEGLSLMDRGPSAEACRDEINVISTATDPAVQAISNFAAAPFELDGRTYESVEGFWQGLKFKSGADRRRVAALSGGEARRAGEDRGYGATVEYEGATVTVGTWDHWALMERACWAKFSQSLAAREALLSTGDRPLAHRVRRDSRTIPGVVMAEIWMRIRAQLRVQRKNGVGLHHETVSG